MGMLVLDHDERLTHVVFRGRLDTTTVERVEQDFMAAVVERGLPAIIELTDIEFIASRGIGMLVAGSKRLQKQGQRMVLLNPQGMVESVLRSSKVDLLIPFAGDLQQARQILGCAAAMTGTHPEATAADGGLAKAPVAVAAEKGKLQLAIKNEISELERLNQSLQQFLGAHAVPARAAYAVDLAIEELVVNVIRYAYVDADEHRIDIEVEIEGEQLVLRIVDDGRAFDPRESPAFNPHAEDYEGGGLGLILVLDLVDTLKYERIENKNRVTVRVHMTADMPGDDLVTNRAQRVEGSGRPE